MSAYIAKSRCFVYCLITVQDIIMAGWAVQHLHARSLPPARLWPGADPPAAVGCIRRGPYSGGVTGRRAGGEHLGTDRISNVWRN